VGNDGFVRFFDYVSLNGGERHNPQVAVVRSGSAEPRHLNHRVLRGGLLHTALGRQQRHSQGITRSIGIFVLALALAYAVAWVVDKVAAFTSTAGTTTMRLALVASILLLAACAEPPRIGITISNTPAPIGACAPPKPGAGCP